MFYFGSLTFAMKHFYSSNKQMFNFHYFLYVSASVSVQHLDTYFSIVRKLKTKNVFHSFISILNHGKR